MKTAPIGSGMMGERMGRRILAAGLGDQGFSTVERQDAEQDD